MHRLAQDFGLGLRQLRKAPGFSVTVILMLALGIGAATAIFSLVEGMLLRPLPFTDPDRLVLLGDHLANGPGISVTAREIDTYSKATEAFSSLGGYITTGYELSGGEVPEEVNAARVTASTFATLGVQPMIGRVFTPQEEEAGQPLAVISYALWLNRYHSDPNILGRSIVLDRKAYSIIGVMPRGFAFPMETGRLDQVEIWVPFLTLEELAEQNAGFWGYQMVARLKAGVTVAQAAQDADRVARQVMASFPASMAAIHIRGDAVPLRERVVEDVRPLLRALFVAASIVLLIACANVSGLLLVRAIRRRRECAVRLALGAGAGAIIRESLVEGLLLSLGGGVLGLGFAAASIRVAVYLLPESMPRIDSISMDAVVATFALLLALATGALCSLAPAFAALRADLTESLKIEGARFASGAPGHRWLRSVLVVSEVAIALVLLTASGAFLRSFQKMRAVNPGFRPENVLVASYQLPLRQYSTDASAEMFNRAVVDRLSSEPGIIAVGITGVLPASGVAVKAAYTIEGVRAEDWKLKFAAFATTYGDYFDAMRIPLLDGRTFTMHDNVDAPLVVIVNQSMAEHSWPGQRAVGKRMHVGNPQKGLPWATVIGVVADTKLGSRDQPSEDQWYCPALQPAILYGSGSSGKLSRPAGGYVTLRSALPPEHMTRTLRSTVAEVDPLLALQQVQSMNEVISNTEAPRRFNTDLITLFALAALALAITGVYAVVAFSASQRTHEIAIRVALGAQRRGIARLVLISGGKLALVGCGLGVLGSLAVSRVIESFLFDVSATDPVIYAAAVAVMMLMALVASTLPAVRAAAADPVEALRAI